MRHPGPIGLLLALFLLSPQENGGSSSSLLELSSIRELPFIRISLTFLPSDSKRSSSLIRLLQFNSLSSNS
uniref:Putative secreted protein n=1 Tax=Panstrongylus lignarius TaxID=156445 RepID=A0A224XUF5_9HEMI